MPSRFVGAPYSPLTPNSKWNGVVVPPWTYQCCGGPTPIGSWKLSEARVVPPPFSQAEPYSAFALTWYQTALPPAPAPYPFHGTYSCHGNATLAPTRGSPQ